MVHYRAANIFQASPEKARVVLLLLAKLVDHLVANFSLAHVPRAPDVENSISVIATSSIKVRAVLEIGVFFYIATRMPEF